jgi:hypothetical protein
VASRFLEVWENIIIDVLSKGSELAGRVALQVDFPSVRPSVLKQDWHIFDFRLFFHVKS